MLDARFSFGGTNTTQLIERLCKRNLLLCSSLKLFVNFLQLTYW